MLNQDTLSWTGQGVVTDRTREHLGRSDRGVIMFRRRLEADLAAVERGEDPSGLVRDPEQNRCIRFPNDLRDGFLTAPTVDAGERSASNGCGWRCRRSAPTTTSS